MASLERFKNSRKLASHPEWLARYLEQGFNYPITLEIDPTNACPLDCGYCVWKDFRYSEKNGLASRELERVVRESAALGVKSIIWTGGGDPLAHPFSAEAIELAASFGMKNGVFTSGVSMTPKVSEKLLGSVSWVRFHIDGATAKTYAETHRVSEKVFDAVVRNISYFSQRKSEKASLASAGIGTVAHEKNPEEAVALGRLARQLNLDYFQYKHDLTRMRDSRYLQWWNKSVVPAMDALSKEIGRDGFFVQYSQGVDYSEIDKSPKCHVHHLNTAITATGDVVYCKSLRDNKPWSLGSIHQNSLKEIFDSERQRQLSAMVTPTTCGIIPCPYKETNEMMEQLVRSGSLALLGEVESIEHQEFI